MIFMQRTSCWVLLSSEISGEGWDWRITVSIVRIDEVFSLLYTSEPMVKH